MDKRFPIEDQIEMLATALKGRVVTPRQAEYDTVRLASLANSDTKRPAAVIRVANAADVAAVLNFVQATGLELAIRSGGHSTVGYSCSDGGLVIDLRDLNTIDIDAAAKTAWCGAGLTAGDVSRAVEKENLIIGFGDAGSVGIGGLTLGGGIGYMVRKYGLTIDNLLAAEIVTASGEIMVTDATRHPDLFWALRGGGGNFGVVTRLQFRLHDLPSFVGGPLVLPATAEVLAGFTALSAAAPDELSTIAYLMPLPPAPFVPAEMHGKLAFVGMLAYAGDAAAAAEVLAPFRALAAPIADLVRPAAYSSVYDLDPPPEFRPAVAIRSRYIDRVTLADAQLMLDAMHACDAPMKMLQVRALGGAFGRVPADATAFGHRDAKVMVAFLAMHAPVPEQAAKYDRWAADALATLQPGSAAGAYVNFLGDEGAAGLSAAYPAGTWERLRRIKRRYDPDNLFRLNQNVPPAA